MFLLPLINDLFLVVGDRCDLYYAMLSSKIHARTVCEHFPFLRTPTNLRRLLSYKN